MDTDKIFKFWMSGMMLGCSMIVLGLTLPFTLFLLLILIAAITG